MRFFLSKKFWLPMLLLLAAEAFFALGGWEPLVEPSSYAGYATRVKTRFATVQTREAKAGSTFVTVGNSLPLLGLEHPKLDANARAYGARHYALAIPGSHLTMLRAQTAWLGRHDKAVKGLVIGVGIRAFYAPTLGYYELPAVMPFRTLDQIPDLMEAFAISAAEPRSLGTFSALVNYREDVAAFLRDPKGRFKTLAWDRRQTIDDVLLFEALPDTNICPIDTSTPGACLASIQNLGQDKSAPGSLRVNEVNRLCTRAARKRQPPVKDAAIAVMRQAWSDLLTPLSQSHRVVVVLMPTHPLMRQYRLPENLHDAAASTLKGLEKQGVISLLDLTTLFDEADHPPCYYFQDLQHAAAAGRSAVTDEVVGYLNDIGFYR